MTDREKGVATAPCGACGTDLPLEDTADGGVTTSECPKCTKKAKPETASQTSGRERGTDTTKES